MPAGRLPALRRMKEYAAYRRRQRRRAVAAALIAWGLVILSAAAVGLLLYAVLVWALSL